MKRSIPILFLSGLAAFASCKRPEPTQVIVREEPSVESLVSTVLNGGGTFKDVPFSSLIETSTGNHVLAIQPEDPTDAIILAGIKEAMDAVLKRYNRADSPTSSEGRINEVSSYFEKAILEEMDRHPDFSCDYPRTADGNLQRSGYPDLMIRHLESGRVIYLDPKLVAEGSLDSSLRTFYFTPKTKTNKVLHDANHLLVGIEHDGNTGAWKILRWHLVDLTRFKVRLKAEFQASNKDLYLPELIIESGSAAE
ncbi:hypothetical protein N9B73_02790 [Verrucomicrobiales bacterium]|nr:hypothetical protein [Verrucomicrobiales bacterium]